MGRSAFTERLDARQNSAGFLIKEYNPQARNEAPWLRPVVCSNMIQHLPSQPSRSIMDAKRTESIEPHKDLVWVANVEESVLSGELHLKAVQFTAPKPFPVTSL